MLKTTSYRKSIPEDNAVREERDTRTRHLVLGMRAEKGVRQDRRKLSDKTPYLTKLNVFI
jgi:hypothetical protein